MLEPRCLRDSKLPPSLTWIPSHPLARCGESGRDRCERFGQVGAIQDFYTRIGHYKIHCQHRDYRCGGWKAQAEDRKDGEAEKSVDGYSQNGHCGMPSESFLLVVMDELGICRVGATTDGLSQSRKSRTVSPRWVCWGNAVSLTVNSGRNSNGKGRPRP